MLIEWCLCNSVLLQTQDSLPISPHAKANPNPERCKFSFSIFMSEQENWCHRVAVSQAICSSRFFFPRLQANSFCHVKWCRQRSHGGNWMSRREEGTNNEAPGRQGQAPGRQGQAPGRQGQAPGRQGEARWEMREWKPPASERIVPPKGDVRFKTASWNRPSKIPRSQCKPTLADMDSIESRIFAECCFRKGQRPTSSLGIAESATHECPLLLMLVEHLEPVLREVPLPSRNRRRLCDFGRVRDADSCCNPFCLCFVRSRVIRWADNSELLERPSALDHAWWEAPKIEASVVSLCVCCVAEPKLRSHY